MTGPLCGTGARLPSFDGARARLIWKGLEDPIVTRRLLPFLLLVLLAACAAPGPTLDQRMSVYIGQGEGELVSGLGVPVRTYEADGRRFLQFEQERTISLPGDPFGYGYYGWRRPWTVPSSYAVVKCELTFAVRQNRVESFSFRGEGCS
jgi:hypothetical protein